MALEKGRAIRGVRCEVRKGRSGAGSPTRSPLTEVLSRGSCRLRPCRVCVGPAASLSRWPICPSSGTPLAPLLSGPGPSACEDAKRPLPVPFRFPRRTPALSLPPPHPCGCVFFPTMSPAAVSLPSRVPLPLPGNSQAGGVGPPGVGRPQRFFFPLKRPVSVECLLPSGTSCCFPVRKLTRGPGVLLTNTVSEKQWRVPGLTPLPPQRPPLSSYAPTCGPTEAAPHTPPRSLAVPLRQMQRICCPAVSNSLSPLRVTSSRDKDGLVTAGAHTGWEGEWRGKGAWALLLARGPPSVLGVSRGPQLPGPASLEGAFPEGGDPSPGR